MSAKHTPGPWVINTAGSAKAGSQFVIDEIYVYAPETQDDTAICADVIDPVTQKPSEANARLIAAAPELLEACRQMMRWFEVEDDHSLMPEFIDRFSLCKQVEFIAASAIAKATGGAQ